MKPVRISLRRQRGTSLVEALVAMAVMALGMLAVVGVQSTLRLNADVAKQRSEAVRIAQEAMEAARGYSAIEAPAEGQTAWADIGAGAAQAVTGYTTNTTFMLTRNVVVHTDAPRKDIRIRVDWTDRSDQEQRVELNSIVGANDPRLALLLAARPNGIPVRQPLGRHPGIPAGADRRDDNKSIFMPPIPGGGVLWVFDDLTGVIVGVCNTVVTGQAEVTQADTQACIDSTTRVGLQLAGFVRFATELAQPVAADAENPTSLALNLRLNLDLASSGHPNPDHVCFTDAPSAPVSYERTQTAVGYRCAILFNKDVPLVWSGISTVEPLPFLVALPPDYLPWAIADNAADSRITRYRVCRYTPATSDSQPIPNRLHPRSYTDVSALEPLRNQNFLVIRAGNGSTAFTCPTDGPIDPAAGDLVNSNTLPHQPAPAG